MRVMRIVAGTFPHPMAEKTVFPLAGRDGRLNPAAGGRDEEKECQDPGAAHTSPQYPHSPHLRPTEAERADQTGSNQYARALRWPPYQLLRIRPPWPSISRKAPSTVRLSADPTPCALGGEGTPNPCRALAAHPSGVSSSMRTDAILAVTPRASNGTVPNRSQSARRRTW